MSDNTNSIIIIPARFDSSRFKGKPLALIKGIPLIERVWRIAQQSKKANQVYIATDSTEIADKVALFGAKVIMTSNDCETGTDRVAQAAADFAQDNSIIVSLQGDAVLTPPWVLDDMIQSLLDNPEIPLATPAIALTGEKLAEFLAHKKVSPSSGTTVVFDKNHCALYFSKQVIPFMREGNTDTALLYRHIGLYAYRYHTLKQLQSLPQSPLEKIEKLEQLRALENAIPIKIVIVDYQNRSHGSIDTPADVAVVEKIIEMEGELV